MLLVISNFILFQLGWFACVLGAAYQLPWVGCLFVAAILMLHLNLADKPSLELRLMLITLLIGGVWDSLMVSFGWLSFDIGMFNSYLAPYWILAMWMLFASTLNVSLRWMKQRYVVAALLGLLAGPLAYYAGSRLGAVSMPDPLAASLVIGLGWFIIMPLLMLLSNHLDGYAESARVGN